MRRPGRATVLTVGSSVVQTQQQAVSLKLRLGVVVVDNPTYEVTTAWQVDQGIVPQVQGGAEWKVDVVDGKLEQVHPRDGRISWDRIRTPDDPRINTSSSRSIHSTSDTFPTIGLLTTKQTAVCLALRPDPTRSGLSFPD